MQKIPLSRVYQSETIDRRILEVVKGGNYILGPECKAFEAALAAYFGVKHSVLASSWTAAPTSATTCSGWRWSICWASI